MSLLFLFSEDEDSVKADMMKKVAEIREFFQNDPLGKSIVVFLKEFQTTCQIARARARMLLKEYLQNLLKEK